MKKTFLTLLCGLLCSLSANAQTELPTPFAQDKVYLGASASGLNLRYNDLEKWNMDLSLKGGYLFEDNWMVTGKLGYDYRQKSPNAVVAGVGLRYYVDDLGLYLGLGADYVHKNKSYDDLMPTIQLGYAFFLNHYVTLEPEIYYNQSLKNHKDYSGFGVSIGLGIYFE